jgi:uncharacterized YigZ family protein
MSVEDNSFWLPEKTGQALYKSRNPKFIGIASRVSSTEAGKEKLREIKTTYPDATHVCYAWVLGDSGSVQMAADAGEPAHSAGTPILNSIRSSGLVWTLVAVVRFYGGSKLGVPGLIEAYSESARLALLDAGKKNELPQFEIELRFFYPSMPLIEKIIHQFQAEILSKDFQESCRFSLSIPVKFQADCFQILAQNSNLIQVISGKHEAQN